MRRLAPTPTLTPRLRVYLYRELDHNEFTLHSFFA